MAPPKKRKKLQAEFFPQKSPSTSRPREEPEATGDSLNRAFDLVDALGDQAPAAGVAPIPPAAAPSDPLPEAELEQVSGLGPSVSRGHSVNAAEMALSTRSIEGRIIVHRSLLLASSNGLLPMPLLDGLLITAVQIRMMQKLADLYDVSFSARRGKWLIRSLGSYAVNTASLLAAASFSKMIPGVGTLLGVTSMPFVAGAFTYALGSVLIRHFESGGDLEAFDPQDHRACFQEEFRQVARDRE